MKTHIVFLLDATYNVVSESVYKHNYKKCKVVFIGSEIDCTNYARCKNFNKNRIHETV